MNRAREHLNEFNERSKAFVESKPYAQVIEPEPQTGFHLLKIKITESFPDAIATVAADALNNLRSALDQIVCACALLAKPGTSLSDLYFPFADTDVKLEYAIAKGCQKLPPEIRAIIRNFKPYAGGDAVFWALSRITRMNRHRDLFTMTPQIDSVEVNLLEALSGPPVFRPYWDSAKNELVISRTTADRELGYDLDTSFHIAFGDVEAIKGFPAVPVIDYLCHVIGSILADTEAECRRLGLLT